MLGLKVSEEGNTVDFSLGSNRANTSSVIIIDRCYWLDAIGTRGASTYLQ